MTATYSVGSLVTARGREWVVLPRDDEEVLRLRPLGGTEDDAVGLFLPLEGHEVGPATFAYPDPTQAGDNTAARLLRDAVRLNFRAGAGPFRSLGRIAVEPRPYQLVPLLMALKLDPVRLLIADDVGIGKTVEAALIARELLDRGEIRRLAVICPSHLCDQWQRELASKFHIDAEIVRPGTVGRLERGLSSGDSLFEVYPFVVVAIDYIKADRRRAEFIRACPEFVIVDEAHTCAASSAARGGQQQRHQLIKDLIRDERRHLVLCTATPHSGVEAAFRSLLVLLDPIFAGLPEDERIVASDPLRQKLAAHFVQRRRADIVAYLDERTTFPTRVRTDAHYELSREYRQLYQRVRDYAAELVQATGDGSRFQQRVRWWAALALLRCVTSSPAAAAAALRTRAGALAGGDDSPEALHALNDLSSRVVLDLDTTDASEADDVVPGADAAAEGAPGSNERRRLREMAAQAEALAGARDTKLGRAMEIIRQLLADGFHPVVYCRYIATAEYVAAELRRGLRGVAVEAVTGQLPAEERALRVAALSEQAPRVLVATDCLSEGINLQHAFDAVVHYDLSWNPTRHEQREGRVDRFGQPAPEVRMVLIYGADNQVDGAILNVLLRKAEAIQQELGVAVPVPADTTMMMEAIFESLFLRNADPRQLTLDFGDAERRVQQYELEWNRAVERERRSRTIYAQRAIHPDEVKRELAEAQAALGDAADVARFVRDACAKLDAPLHQEPGRALLTPGALPAPVQAASGLTATQPIAFTLPVPDDVTYVARTHPLVEALGSYLMDIALAPDPRRASPAARCGAIRTRAVSMRTTLLLLRLRLHIGVTRSREGTTEALLAEETIITGYRGRGTAATWLSAAEAEALVEALPAANVPAGQREHWLREALADLPAQDDAIAVLANERAAAVLAAHRRVRDAARMTGISYRVHPTLPADILGLYVLMPTGGVA